MPIKINKSISVTGVKLPYTYTFSNTLPTVSFSNQTGTSSNASLVTDIIFPTEASVATSTSSLVIVGADGCRTTTTLTTTTPCNTNLTMSVSGYRVLATLSAPGCTQASKFTWSFDPTVLELANQVDSGFSSGVQFLPKAKAALPASTPISVTATDCFGCEATTTGVVTFTLPEITLSNNVYISCPDTDSVYRGTVYVTPTSGSSQIDWTTFDVVTTLTAGFNIEVDTVTMNNATVGRIQFFTSQLFSAEDATFTAIVKDVYGIETRKLGTVTLRVCSRVGNIPAATIFPTATNVSATAISGDVIVIPVTNAVAASTLVDWNTAQVLSSPAYISSSITFRTTPELEQVIDYEYAGAPDLFAWTVDDVDGNTLPPSTVSISVLPTPPVVNTDNVDMVIGETEIINVLSNDTSAGGLNPASLRIITPSTSGGEATANADGTITYTSDVTDTGGTIIQYKVNDIYNQESNLGSVIITRISAGNESSQNLCAVALASTSVNLYAALAGTRIVTTGGTWTNLGTASPSPAAPGTYNGDITFTQGTHAAGTHTYRYTVTSGSASDTADVEVTFITHAVPSNNECAGATVLSISGRGGNSTLSDLNLAEACPGNAAATLSVTALPTAWGAYSFTSDVWYTFTATPYYDTISMTYLDYRILVTASGTNYGTEEGIFFPAIAIYDGTCGALVERSATLTTSESQTVSAQANMTGSTSKTFFVRVSAVTGYEGKYSINLTA